MAVSTSRAIVVTGAAKRLGRQIACDLASDGWSIILHYRESRKEAEETKQMCEEAFSKSGEQFVELVQGDFSTIEGVNEFSRDVIHAYEDCLYGLVNNVGNFFWEKASQTDAYRANDLFLTNFFAPVELIRSLSPLLKARGGSIVNIGTSGLHRFGADTYAPIYHASKLSLFYLTKSYAKELAPWKVSVNMVSPGKMDNSIDLDIQSESQSIPFGRLGKGEEVSRVVAFLLREENRYITGQNIEVSGAFCL